MQAWPCDASSAAESTAASAKAFMVGKCKTGLVNVSTTFVPANRHAPPLLESADLVAKCLGDPDVIILALRDMPDVVCRGARATLPATSRLTLLWLMTCADGPLWWRIR